MVAKHILRILLRDIKTTISQLIQQGKARNRLIAAQPSLANAFGQHVLIDEVTTVGAHTYLSSNLTIRESVIGNNVTLGTQVTLRNAVLDSYVALGDNDFIDASRIASYTYLGRDCWITNTTIGKFCSIAQRLSCGAGNHPTHMLSTSPAFYQTYPICGISFSANNAYEGQPATTIGHDVWIGADVFIKSGVKVGNGAIIAAGAMVMKDVAPYAIVGGVPAREIRKRYPEDQIQILEALAWWDLPESEFRELAPIMQTGDVLALQSWKADYDKRSSPPGAGVAPR
jgi:chloramphenicol O-acetyltransferase type B